MTLTWPRAYAFVRAREGGFANLPGDRGGPTFAGVALRTVAALDADGDGRKDFDLDGDGDVDIDDIRALAGHPGKVETFYRDRYWTPVRAAELPPHLALFAFDSAVHHGVSAAALLLQRGVAAHEDGVIGPETIARAQAAWATGLHSCLVHRLSLFRAIHARRPATLAFADGWNARVLSLQQEAFFLTRGITSAGVN